MADGTTYQIDIATNAAGVEPAAAAVARLASRLTEGKSAAELAAEAVKKSEASYRQLEANANKAALAVEKLAIEAQSASGAKLQNLIARQAEAAAKSKAATEAMNKEAVTLDKLTSASDKLAKAEKAKEAASGSGKVNEMAEAFGKLGGPLGSIGQKVFGAADGLRKLGGSMGSTSGILAAGAIGTVAVVAAVVAVTAAAIAGVVAIGKWAIGLADAARSSSLLSAGIARTVAGGELLDAKIADLTGQLPTTREELMGIAKTLADSGLRGKDLTDALQTSAVEAAKLQFGPDFKKAMLSLPFQTARLQTSFSKLFSGLKIEKLLEAFSKLVDLFDDSQASGKAIKSVFESLFQPLIDGLTTLLPKAVTFFIQLEIMALKALIMIKPYGAAIEAIAIGFAVVIGTILILAAILVAFAVAMTAVVALIIAMPFWIKSAFSAAVDWLSSLSFTEIGTNLIQGLIDGILAGGAGVLKAITGIAGGAVDAAKSLLGIHSPSKVFAEIGMHTAAGMEQGIDKGADGVQSSMTDMVNPSAAAGAAGSSSGAGGATYSIVINASGGDGASIADALRAVLADLGVQSGTAVPHAA